MSAHEQFQVLVGEMQQPRLEYLYEMSYCEIILISRGYWRRYRTSWRQARMIAYYVRYCMGVGKDETVKTESEFYPFPWERETHIPTEEERNEILSEIDRLNAGMGG